MTIRILPARLANQIAAGEVVERPASVVKELLENCLDAGATKIEVEIIKGGHKRILVRDNGGGIEKNQLTLALSRHATSKIATLQDLENIGSLGFRGEALASISSVSRLTLTSRPGSQSEAWQAHAEGRDMEVKVNPAAHPPGTSVDVMDLFFNTPARRKFLRTEKTEFTHIDELFKRAALSHYGVHFILKHNDKVVRNYPAVTQTQGKLKRVIQICGRSFNDHALQFNSEYQDIRFVGWLCDDHGARAQNDQQFCYINGRIMRDKLVTHAIRQAYEGLIEPNSYPAYVVYLTMPTQSLDVNVHPTKQEVRFHQARLVHDFIYKTVNDALQQYMSQVTHKETVESEYSHSDKAQINQGVEESKERVSGYVSGNAADLSSSPDLAQQDTVEHQESTQETSFAPFSKEYQTLQGEGAAHGYIKPLQSADNPQTAHTSAAFATPMRQQSSVSRRASQNYQQLMQASDNALIPNADLPLMDPREGTSAEQAMYCLPVDNKTMLVKFAGQFWILPVFELQQRFLIAKLTQDLPVAQPLLMPVAIAADKSLLTSYKLKQNLFAALNIDIVQNNTKLVLRQVPAGFRQLNWSGLLEAILASEWQAADELEPTKAFAFFARHVVTRANTFSDVEQLNLWRWACDWLESNVSLEKQLTSCSVIDVKKWLL